MKIKKLLLYLCVILLSFSTAYAQNSCYDTDTCGSNWDNFAYSDPSSDILSIPPDKVKIEEVLLSGRGDELTKEQIMANLNKIDDLNKVNFQNAQQALMEKYGVTVETFGDGANVKDGILRANFGQQDHISISNQIYRNGILKISDQGEIIFIPNKELAKLDITKGDSIVIGGAKTNLEYNGNTFEGTFRINWDETITFLKGKEAVIDGIIINPMLEDVKLCNSLAACHGEHLYLSENELAAAGSFSLAFLGQNKFFQVIDAGFPIGEIIGNQNDLMKIFLGNDAKNGEIDVKTSEGLLPMMKTKGFVMMENDENKIEIDGPVVKTVLFKDTQIEPIDSKATRGSVNVAIIADNNEEQVLVLDENQRVHISSKGDFDSITEKRQELAERGILLSGYFSSSELQIFKNQIDFMENELDIDFKKLVLPIDSSENFKTRIFEMDQRNSRSAEAFVKPILPNIIFWQPDLTVLDIASRVEQSKESTYKLIFNYYRDSLLHEFGHVIENLDIPYSLQQRSENPELMFQSPLMDSFKTEMEKSGIKLEEIKDPETNKVIVNYKIISGPEDLFPTSYSKDKSLKEFIAEIFATFREPEWFTDPYRGKSEGRPAPTQLQEPISPEMMKERQKFRDLWLETLKKFKK